MGRGFYWEDHGTDDGIDHAVLYGPEPYTVAAVVTLDRIDPILEECSWRVMSGEYRCLNFEEENTSLPIEGIKRRMLIRLMNELRQRNMDLNTDMSSVTDLLFNEEEGKKR